MSKYKISMIIPTFNVEMDIIRPINSLKNQTIGFENIEVIFVDDCSTDNTRQILLDYEEKYDNIRCIFLEQNSGSAGKPRNIGIDNASADYVMFLDNDDEYVDVACEILYDKIVETDVNLVVVCKTNNLFSDSDNPREIVETPEFEIVNVLDNPEFLLFSPTTQYSGAMWNKIFKKEFLLNNHIRCLEGVPEDTYFMHHCYYVNPNVIFLTNLYLYNHYFYRVKGKSISVTLSRSHLNNGFKIFEKLRDLSLKFEGSENFFNTFCSGFFKEYVYMIVKYDGSRNEKKELMRMYKDCAEGLSVNISEKFAAVWYRLVINNHFNLALIYSYVVTFAFDVRHALRNFF